jgi:hypothetical protein
MFLIFRGTIRENPSLHIQGRKNDKLQKGKVENRVFRGKNLHLHFKDFLGQRFTDLKVRLNSGEVLDKSQM